jgi:hypothetical protein
MYRGSQANPPTLRKEPQGKYEVKLESDGRVTKNLREESTVELVPTRAIGGLNN